MSGKAYQKKKSLFFHNQRFGQNGVTLIELLIAMAMLSFVAGLFVSEHIRQQNQEMTQAQAVTMQQSVRASMLLMTKEFRMAGYDPEKNFNAGITDAGDDFIDFSYVDSGALQTMSYRHEDHGGDGDLRVNKGGGGYYLLSENIETLNLEYLDEEGSSIVIDDPVSQGTLDMIRAVRITITAGVDSQQRDLSPGNNTRTLIKTVKFRNLGL